MHTLFRLTPTLLGHWQDNSSSLVRVPFDYYSTGIRQGGEHLPNKPRTTVGPVSYPSPSKLELKSNGSHSQLNKVRVDFALRSQKVRKGFGLLIPILYLAYTETVDKQKTKGRALPKASRTKCE